MDNDDKNTEFNKNDEYLQSQPDEIRKSIDQLPENDNYNYGQKVSNNFERRLAQSNLDNPKPKKSKKLLVIVILVLILIASLGAAWYFVFYKNQQSTNSDNSASDNTKKAEVITDPQLSKFITSTTGETWLEKPEAVSRQGFYIKSTMNDSDDSNDYFKVGSRGKNTIYMVRKSGGIMHEYVLFEKSSDSQVTFINHPDGNGVYNSDGDAYLSSNLTSGVKISNDIHYDSLSIPDKISIDDKGSVLLSPSYPNLGFEYSEPTSSSVKYTVVKQLGGNTLYKSESTNAETKLVSITYFIKNPLNNQVNLRYLPIELSLANYKWSVGVSDNTDTIKAITYGCGNINASVTRIDDLAEDDIRVVGKSGNGVVIYGFKDMSSDLFKKAFNEFIEFYKNDPTSSNKSMTQAEFLRENAVIFAKDANGKWLVYVRTKLSPVAGCAKPVVYLYPTTKQIVNVKVGADVKVSEPNYDASKGWTAIANPNGQLVVDGKPFSSLFWEGPGYGQYPEITEGVVVKHVDALKTIKTQLVDQGLNDNEIKDFTQYWQDKIPASPYVRLTWFNTAQMDALAPLKVTPKPDTSIRVFLDMAGLEKPISLPKQNLKNTTRRGFTLVEWGGLSSRKLY